MNFEPQCKEQADLYEQMARVLRMCKEAGFDRPGECVKLDGFIGREQWEFSVSPDRYEFALAIVEGRPVFRGCRLWGSHGGEFIVGDFSGGYLCEVGYTDRGYGVSQYPSMCSWNPSKTIKINGVEVKAPLSVEGSDDAEHPERHGVFITFKDYEDAEAFKAALEGKTK